MLERANSPGFELGCFSNSAPYPEGIEELLAENGYEMDDYGQGMLFASQHGVIVHHDEHPSVLWVLAG